MDKSKKKELQEAYKNRSVTGGIYCIECGGNHKKWLKSTTDMEGARNRFEFSARNKGCPEPAMSREFAEYGGESFTFSVVEELKKAETQSAEEFAQDLRALLEMWREKLGQ